MRQLFLGLALGALACVAQAQGLIDRKTIDVDIVNGKISVEEQEAHTNAREGALLWRIAPDGYVFTTDGIVIDSKGKHRCAIVGNGRIYRCAKLRHDKGEKYKYTVKINDVRGPKPVALDPLDPWVVND